MRQLKKMLRAISVIVSVLSVSSFASAQNSHEDKRLSLKGGVGTIVERGEIGGESQHRYQLRLEAGRKMTVTLFSQQNKAGFTICNGDREGFGDSDICEGSKTIRFKRPDRSGKVRYRKGEYWSGSIPRTGEYEIAVSAYPGSANYTLRVTVQR